MDEKVLLVILAAIAALRRWGGTMLRQVRVIPAAEFVALMGVSLGMSFVIVFMLGPALGELLRFSSQ